ncbi:Phage portal protein [compost metagenome]
MAYHGITMNPEAAQMLQTRSYNVEEICRWFGVPPFMIGHMDKQSSWASSVESQNLHFLTSCLRPLLVNIEQEILRCLVEDEGAGDVFAEFSVEGLLRADSAGRAAYYRFGLQDGWLSRNEVRAKENLAPIEGGEIYTVQANLVALTKLGEVGAEGERVRAALKAWLGAVEESAATADAV